MRKKKSIFAHTKKYGVLFLAAVLVAVVWGRQGIQAALQREESVSSVHVSDDEIEMSTLVIGSHLIHIDGLSDALYQIAVESGNIFQQNQMYYKSELAGGAWFEISTATSVNEITSAGSPVDKSVIEELEFTHKTGADGVTVDLLTGDKVCAYDINNPYDLQNMEELEPIRIQYELLQKKDKKSESDRQYIELIQELFAKDIRDEVTNDCDRIIEGLENYRRGLSPREKPGAWQEAVDTVMGSTDARRRVRSLETLDGLLDIVNQKATGIQPLRELTEDEQQDKEKKEEEGKTWDDPREIIETVDSQVVDAVGTAIENVQASISDYSAKVIDQGETATSQARYRYSADLEQNGKAENEPGCDTATENLCNLDNIMAGKVVDTDSELASLSEDLTASAKDMYKAKLSAGVSEEYQAAQEEGAAGSVLARYLENQKSDTDAARLEYQTMLSALFERMANEAAQTYTLNLIEEIPSLRALVPEDPAFSYQLGTVEEHLRWLKKEYGELVAKSGDGTDMDRLKENLSDLQRQKQDALDNNDLAGAKKLDAQIEAGQQDIDDLAGKLTDILASPNASQSDRAKALAGLGEGNTASKIQELTDNMMEDLLSGGADAQSLSNQTAALSALGQLDADAAKAGIDGLKDMLQALEGESSGEEGQTEESGAGTEGVIDSALADALLSDLSQIESSLAETKHVLTPHELEGLLAEILGGSLDSAKDARQASAVLAIEWYGQEKKNRDVLEYAGMLAERMRSSNPYCYRKYTGQSGVYVSLKSVGKVLGYRYIFDDAHQRVTLQKSKDYYSFTAGQSQYECSGGGKKELSGKAGMMGTVYIRSADCENQFVISGEYIEKSDQGIAVTALVRAGAREIYNELMERG